jgi:hypothetical protein
MESIRHIINSALDNADDATIQRMAALVERIKEDMMHSDSFAMRILPPKDVWEDDEILYILDHPQIPEDGRGDYAYIGTSILSTPNRNGDRFPVQPVVTAVQAPSPKPTDFNGHVFMRTDVYACQQCAFADKCVNAPPPMGDVCTHLCETWLAQMGIDHVQDGCWVPEEQTLVCHDPDSMFYGYRYIHTEDSMCNCCAFLKQCSEGDLGDDRVTVLCEKVAGPEYGYWEKICQPNLDLDTLFHGYKWETEGGCAKCRLRKACTFKEVSDMCKSLAAPGDEDTWYDGCWVEDTEHPPADKLVRPSVKLVEIDFADVERQVVAAMATDTATRDAIMLDEKAQATRKLNALVDTDPTGQTFWVSTMEQSCKDCFLGAECDMVSVGNNPRPPEQAETWRKFIKLCKLRVAYNNFGHWLKKIPEQSASDADKAQFEGFKWVLWEGGQTTCVARCEVKACGGCDSDMGHACRRVIASTQRNPKGHWRWILDPIKLAESRFKGYHLAYRGEGCAHCQFKACDNPEDESEIIDECVCMRGGSRGADGKPSRARGNWERDRQSDNAANTQHNGNETPVTLEKIADMFTPGSPDSVENTRFKGYEWVQPVLKDGVNNECDVCEFEPCKCKFDHEVITDCLKFCVGPGCWRRIPGSQVRITAADTPFEGYAYRADQHQSCTHCPVCAECSSGKDFSHQDCIAITHSLPGRWVEDEPCDKDGFTVPQED